MARKDRLSEILASLLAEKKINQVEAKAIRLALFEFASSKGDEAAQTWISAVKQLLCLQKK